jgi:hypothetical protein
MPTALRNRFAHFHIVPDYAAWRVWAVANNVAPELIAFLHLRQDFLHMMPKGDENAFPTPRSLVKASKYVDEDKEDRMAMFAAHIGDAVAAEFDGFIDLYKTFGGLDQIIANPKTAALPNESSIRYAVCVGLARMATRKTLPSIIEYAERLPRESQILVVTDATTRDESLKNTQVYGAWSVKNQDIIIQS